MFDINVVIVNYKMKDDIERCLSSLFADSKDSGLSIHCVVVDNGSLDDIEPLLKDRFPQVQCVTNQKNLGFGKAQNQGINQVEARYHFILNPDTYFFPGGRVLKKMFDYMSANEKVGIIGPKILYPDGSLQYSCFRFPTFWQPIFRRTRWGLKGKGKIMNDHLIMLDFDHTKTIPVDWVMGSAMFVRSQAAKEVGLFDDRFWMYYEDSDWCRRMWEAGWPVYYAHDIVIEHVLGRQSAKVQGTVWPLVVSKLARQHVISWLKYMWKWRGNYKYYATKPKPIAP